MKHAAEGNQYIQKVLIANRGEIAWRAMQACQELGIDTVSVYAEDDKDSKHVWLSKEAYSLGEGALANTYLNQERLIEIALYCGAQAIYPGYGFLAENYQFVKKVENAGLIFIGPRSEHVKLFGDKNQSRELACRVGLPIIGGMPLNGESAEFIEMRFGFPVLVKALSGGGGKGMRIVTNKDEWESACSQSRSEAAKAFGDDSLLVEKYIEHGRHIEVQVLSDSYGHHVHLFERECSLQRRYQKIVEESPALNLSDSVKQTLYDAAIKITSFISYRGAGTVEFLLAPDGHYYFLEVNPRIQVEHPVTEALTGIDLVKWQMRIARGEALDFEQKDVRANGHAIEVRVCSENPINDFMPTAGIIQKWNVPLRKDVRFDSAMDAGVRIGTSYDSMIAKIIAWGSTREETIEKLKAFLNDFYIEGVKNNREYLLGILKHEKFSGLDSLDVHFLSTYHDQILANMVWDENTKALAIAAKLLLDSDINDATEEVSEANTKTSSRAKSIWKDLKGFRNE